MNENQKEKKTYNTNDCIQKTFFILLVPHRVRLHCDPLDMLCERNNRKYWTNSKVEWFYYFMYLHAVLNFHISPKKKEDEKKKEMEKKNISTCKEYD